MGIGVGVGVNLYLMSQVAKLLQTFSNVFPGNILIRITEICCLRTIAL